MNPDRIRHSLVLRTTLAVLAVGLLVGLAALGLAGRIASGWEVRRQRQALEALLDVVAPSANAAVFADDRALAEQVAQGLIATPLVHGAVLRSRGVVLAEADRTGAGRGPLAGAGPQAVIRALVSPFAAQQVIGELALVPDAGVSREQEARTASLIRTLLLGVAAALMLATGIAVNGFILKPITDLAVRLHDLDPDAGGRLQVPAGHDGDEIGHLVGDVNALVVRMVNAIWREQEASRQLAGEPVSADPVGTGIFVVRGDGALEAWTPPFLALLGLEQAPPAAGSRLPGLFGGNAAQIEAALGRCLAERVPVRATLRVPGLRGAGHRWLQFALEPLGPDWCQGLLDDVGSPGRKPCASGTPATRDDLTGALNRLGAEYALGEPFAQGARGMGILLVDLDRFELINQQFGREAGDAVLMRAATRMAAALRHSDSVARLSEDTFLVILDGLDDTGAGLRLVDKLLAVLAAPFPLGGGREARVEVSLGLTLRRAGEEPNRRALLGRADQALRQAKTAGGGCARLA